MMSDNLAELYRSCSHDEFATLSRQCGVIKGSTLIPSSKILHQDLLNYGDEKPAIFLHILKVSRQQQKRATLTLTCLRV